MQEHHSYSGFALFEVLISLMLTMVMVTYLATTLIDIRYQLWSLVTSLTQQVQEQNEQFGEQLFNDSQATGV